MNNAKQTNKKKIEENSRMEKTYRDLFKKIGYPKGTFHGKMSTRKDRKCKDLIEAQGNISRKDERKKGQKVQGSNRSRRD